MSVRSENLKRRRLRCLRCGKHFWTDRCHRVCNRCYANSGEIFVRPAFSGEGISLLNDLPLVDGLGIIDDETLDEEPSSVTED